MTTTTALQRSTQEYGADALIVCDNLVRIYQIEEIEVQALQRLHLDLFDLIDAHEVVADDEGVGAVLLGRALQR